MTRKFLPVFVAVLSLIALESCLSFPRRAVSVSRASDLAAGRLGGKLAIGKITVTRRTFAEEIRRDLESLVPAFSLGEEAEDRGVSVDIEVVERDVMRDFAQSYATMIVMRFAPIDSPDAPGISVIMTMESKDSVASPYVLKRYVEDCLRIAGSELKRAIKLDEKSKK